MKLKKRYKIGLKIWIEGIQLKKKEWINKNGYYIYYIPNNSWEAKCLIGFAKNPNKYYYYSCCNKLMPILLENGLKSRIEKL